MIRNPNVAHELCAAGVPVFPCDWRGDAAKRPLIGKKQGGQGFHDATIETATVAAWWTKYPNALVGVPVPVGVVVVDCDTNKVDRITGEVHSGDETLRGAGLLTNADKAGLVVQTPSGGKHRFFRVPDDVLFSNTSNVNRLPAVDLRTGGSGYVIAPGAGYAVGVYVALKGDMLQGFQLLPMMPDSLVAALRRPEAGPASDAGYAIVMGQHPGEGWAVDTGRFRMQPRERNLLEKRLNALLASTANRLALIGKGGRHSRLLAAARSLGGYLHYRAFTADDVARALYRASEANGHIKDDGSRVALLAIRDGLNDGMNAPLALESRRRPIGMKGAA